PDGSLRTVHPVVAFEVLVQLSGVPRDQWKQRLVQWGHMFVDFCRDINGVDSADALELLFHVFVYRGSQDVLGTERAGRSLFARFVEDIPSQSGAADLLKHLADSFPHEEHFAAHMARYFAFELRNY